jgi:hypothetical protein
MALQTLSPASTSDEHAQCDMKNVKFMANITGAPVRSWQHGVSFSYDLLPCFCFSPSFLRMPAFYRLPHPFSRFAATLLQAQVRFSAHHLLHRFILILTLIFVLFNPIAKLRVTTPLGLVSDNKCVPYAPVGAAVVFVLPRFLRCLTLFAEMRLLLLTLEEAALPVDAAGAGARVAHPGAGAADERQCCCFLVLAPVSLPSRSLFKFIELLLSRSLHCSPFCTLFLVKQNHRFVSSMAPSVAFVSL